MEGLTTGRIVHYNRSQGQHQTCRAAVVVQVWDNDGLANLCVLPDGITEEGGVVGSVPYDPDGATFSWHWPEREDT